jgi:non-ribosomal peptide synthetase component E (peptide arylation enzyme)
MRSPFLPDWVLAHAESNPEAPAVASPEARLSHGDLAERMRVLSARLAAADVGPGERVLIALATTGSRRTLTWKSSRRPTSSNGDGRCSSTITLTG